MEIVGDSFQIRLVDKSYEKTVGVGMVMDIKCEKSNSGWTNIIIELTKEQIKKLGEDLIRISEQ